MFGAPILGVWYWCTDQFIVPRPRRERCDTARKGALFGGYLKLLPLFIFMMPGVVAFALAEKIQNSYLLERQVMMLLCH